MFIFCCCWFVLFLFFFIYLFFFVGGGSTVINVEIFCPYFINIEIFCPHFIWICYAFISIKYQTKINKGNFAPVRLFIISVNYSESWKISKSLLVTILNFTMELQNVHIYCIVSNWKKKYIYIIKLNTWDPSFNERALYSRQRS